MLSRRTLGIPITLASQIMSSLAAHLWHRGTKSRCAWRQEERRVISAGVDTGNKSFATVLATWFNWHGLVHAPGILMMCTDDERVHNPEMPHRTLQYSVVVPCNTSPEGAQKGQRPGH